MTEDVRLQAAMRALEDYVPENLRANAAQRVLGQIDQVPTPVGRMDKGTLAAAREILHVHRFDNRDGKTGTPDSFYGGIAYGTALLRQVGAHSLGDLVNTRQRVEELLDRIDESNPPSKVMDTIDAEWLVNRLQHIVEHPNWSFETGGLSL